MALDFRNKGRPPVNRDLSRLDGAATRYRAALRQWIEILEERDRCATGRVGCVSG